LVSQTGHPRAVWSSRCHEHLDVNWVGDPGE
jgi:hypothetical protein